MYDKYTNSISLNRHSLFYI